MAGRRVHGDLINGYVRSKMLINRPEIIGIGKIPERLRNFQSFSKDIVSLLPQIDSGKCLVLSFKDEEELRIGRKQILTAGMRQYGSGRVQTGSNDNCLFVWLRDKEINPNEELVAKINEVIHAR